MIIVNKHRDSVRRRAVMIGVFVAVLAVPYSFACTICFMVRAAVATSLQALVILHSGGAPEPGCTSAVRSRRILPFRR